MNITVWEWFEQRSFHFRDFQNLAEGGATRNPLTTTLVLPTRNVADTIGPILDTVARLNARTGLIEQVVSPYARARDGEARDHAVSVVRELAALSVRLHTALVRAGLSAELLR